MRVLMLAGPKRSGKNTLADMIERHTRDWSAPLVERAIAGALIGPLVQLSLADPIRAAADAIGLPPAATRANKDAPCAELGGRSGRDFLIMLGMGTREIHAPFWCEALIRQLTALERANPHTCAAITDLRFVNEVAAIESWAAAPRTAADLLHYVKRETLTVWIERPGHDQDEVLERAVRGRANAHIDNSGSLADLDAAAHHLAGWCLTGRKGWPGWAQR